MNVCSEFKGTKEGVTIYCLGCRFWKFFPIWLQTPTKSLLFGDAR